MILNFLLSKVGLMRKRHVMDAMVALRKDLPSDGHGYVRDKRWVEFWGHCHGKPTGRPT